jgi:hypothetical protein
MTPSPHSASTITPSTTMNLHTTIADRLLNAFPSSAYGLPALLQLSEIVETTDVPTAAVECTMRPRLLMNPDFVAKHANTSEKLVMLIMHELHHVILGHTRLHERQTPLDNVVFDAVINAMLCWMFPERSLRALFTDFYDHHDLMQCFLRPPPEWSLTNYGPPPAALASAECAELAGLHRRLYSDQGVGYDELRRAFQSHTLAQHLPEQVVLLGDHRPQGEGSSSDGHLERRSPELLEQVRRIIEDWPTPPNPRIGRSVSDFLQSIKVVPTRPSSRSRLRSLLRQVAGRGGTTLLRGPSERVAVIESPLPRIDRRSAVLHGLGLRPILYQHTLASPRPGRGGKRVHVYVDVSGSMSTVLGPLYGAVLDCKHFVHPTVHLFSTVVRDIPIAELSRGLCVSTGGTSIECVAMHIKEHGISRAVLVTDGYVGQPRVTSLEVLKRCRLGVALLGESRHRTDLEQVVDAWLELSEEER